VAWAKGVGNAKSWGMSISHIERSQLVGSIVSKSKLETLLMYFFQVYGPPNNNIQGSPASYYIKCESLAVRDCIC
jgi:hypothetical protein